MTKAFMLSQFLVNVTCFFPISFVVSIFILIFAA